ncbi:MAG: hypothetical protein MJD61_21355 [Proteobacteria bacterium]|nr:hypothetical protein [Pseudomonadota bacterium]
MGEHLLSRHPKVKRLRILGCDVPVGGGGAFRARRSVDTRPLLAGQIAHSTTTTLTFTSTATTGFCDTTH